MSNCNQNKLSKSKNASNIMQYASRFAAGTNSTTKLTYFSLSYKLVLHIEITD